MRKLPRGYNSVNPYLVVENAPKVFDFVQKAFGAAEARRTPLPDGSVLNIEALIGNSIVFLAQAPQKEQVGSSVLYMYVDDADEMYRNAIKAGATSIMEPANLFFGDRMGGVKDPFGNQWWIAQRIETLTTKELKERTSKQKEIDAHQQI